jgi:hypothetical protein
MPTLYKDFRPSQFDNHIYVAELENLFVAPVMLKRDSSALERSNFRIALKSLGPSAQVYRFGHWACGWFEIILTDDEKAITEMGSSLANYPVLDDEDFSQEEQQEADEVWKNCYSIKDRIDYIRKFNDQFEFHNFRDMLHCVKGDYFAGYASELLY